MNKLTLFATILALFFVSFASAATVQPLFNGNFSNGTTLYTDSQYISSGFIYGKDVYPIRSTIPAPETVCVNKTITYIKPTMINGTVHLVTETKVVQSCKLVKAKIGCVNPATGVYTNQLSLKSFSYSTDGINWSVVPYSNQRIQINNSSVQFKVDIPQVCSPQYDINKAIYLRT